jgi:hypothetical protein
MKIVIIILSVIVLNMDSCSGQSNNQNVNNNSNMIKKVDIIGSWRIDAIIGLELQPNIGRPKTDEYTLFKLREEDKTGRWIFGWSAEFRSDMTFESSYSSPDGFGNTQVSGTYQFVDEYRIRINIGTMMSVGGWYGNDGNAPEMNVELGVFIIAPTENGFRLIKSADGETDLQRLTYSDMLHVLPEIRTGSHDLKWVKLDPNNRDTDNLKILNKGLVADGRYNPDKAKLLYSRNISSGWDYTTAFIFRYEGKNIIALYSPGPEIFAIYDK